MENVAQRQTVTELRMEVDRLKNREAELSLSIEELRKKHCLLTEYLDNAPILCLTIFVLTKQVVACNQSLAKALGYTQSALIGQQALDLFSSSSHRRIRHILESESAEQFAELANFQLLHVDGSEIQVNLNVAEGADESGKSLFLHFICRVMTERHTDVVKSLLRTSSHSAALKDDHPGTSATLDGQVEDKQYRQALQALQSSEERFQESKVRFYALFRHAAIGIALIDANKRFIEVNPTFERLMGYSSMELVEMSITDCTHPEDRDNDALLFKELTNGSRDSYQTVKRYLYKNGKEVHGNVCVSAVKDRNRQFGFAIVMVEDLSETESAKLRLQAALLLAGEFRRFFEISNELACVIDPDGVIVVVNPAWNSVLGHEMEELVGRPYTDLVYADDIPTALQKERLTVKSSTQLLNDEIRLLHIDGTYRWFSRTSIFDPGTGKSFRVARDITQNKRAEKRLRKLAAELQRSNLELEQFAYIASHDLQSPIRTVINYLQLLLNDYEGKLDETASHYVLRAENAAQKMKRLIKGLLTYSRIRTQGNEFGPVECSYVLKTALNALQAHIESSEAKISFDPLPRVQGDELQLEQLFQNLLENALKYKSDQAPRIHISAQRRGNKWQFTVKDNGIGIDPDYNERIFLVFQRLHTSEEYPGTGIGLALCKQIVERHGGEIWVESLPNKGADFHFLLKPAKENDHAKQ